MSASLDTVYTAETPEGIALSLRPAGVVARLYAFSIDMAVRLALLIGAMIALSAFGRLGTGILLVIAFGLEWFYPVVFELTRSGATPGKQALGLQVVMDSGLPISTGASLLRNLLRAADFLPFGYALGFAAMLMRADFKRAGDLAAGTIVVYSKSVSLHGPLPQAEPMAPTRALSQRQQAVIVAWAARASRITKERHDELALIASPQGATRDARAASQSLLSIAQWLMGRR